MIGPKKRFRLDGYNSFPIIWHHNGRNSHNRTGINLKKRFFDQFSNENENDGKFLGRKDKLEYFIPKKHPENIPVMVNDYLTIFMVNNNLESGSAARCLDHYGCKYTVIGQNITKYNHFIKYKVIYDYFKNTDFSTKYVMFFDADDIFLTRPLNELVFNFEKHYKCKMLFNSEVFFYPEGGGWDSVAMKLWEQSINPNPGNPYQYLCSGIWIAETEFLKKVIDEFFPHPDDLILSGIDNDQAFYKTLYQKYYPDIQIDRENKWIYSTAWSSTFGKENVITELD